MRRTESKKDRLTFTYQVSGSFFSGDMIEGAGGSDHDFFHVGIHYLFKVTYAGFCLDKNRRIKN